MKSPAFPASSATRRKLLSLGGLGTLGGLAAYLGWSRSSLMPRAQLPAPVSTSGMPQSAAPTEALTETVGSHASGVFSRNAFIPHLHSEFMLVQVGKDSAACRLVEVSSESRISSPKGDYVSFALLFEASPSFLRAGGICRVQHAEMSEMEFFLSPVGRTGRKALLEAVFNLPV